ncbi:GNAT family N-acetyltransferase [Aquirufa sp. 5-AUSEE-100C1]
MEFLLTNRLHISPVALDDADFMLNLLNSPGFIRFIGDRQVRTIEEAEAYIANLINDPDITYWVIRNKETKDCLGVVTWVKRDFLPAPDLGYALLPEFEGKGYAFEASQTWLAHQKNNHASVLAICQAENATSIKLLLKLGFSLQELFEREGLAMHKYAFHQ